MTKLLLYISVVSLIFISCSKEDDVIQEMTFANGFFIINTGSQSSGESAGLRFNPYDDNDSGKFYFTDLFSLINNENITGFLLDMALNNKIACLLTRDEYDRLIITDKRTMRKEKEIPLDSSESIAIFLTEHDIHIFSHNFILRTINIDSEQITSTKNFSYLSGIISDVKFYKNKLYFSTNGEYGRVHVVDINSNEPLVTYNIGLSINSIVPLEDGIYIAAEQPDNSYDSSELINPTIANGIIKIDPVSGEVIQKLESEFPYPYSLTYDNGLFLFLQSRYKSHPSNTFTKFWNKTTGVVSEPLENLRPTYKTTSFFKLKDSRIYFLDGDYVSIFDLDSNLIRATSTGSNSRKLVFLD
jgi:hypothetical protein